MLLRWKMAQIYAKNQIASRQLTNCKPLGGGVATKLLYIM